MIVAAGVTLLVLVVIVIGGLLCAKAAERFDPRNIDTSVSGDIWKALERREQFYEDCLMAPRAGVELEGHGSKRRDPYRWFDPEVGRFG